MATDTHTPNVDDWLSLQRAAERAGVHEATLRRLIKAGLLRHARVGRKLIRIRQAWLDEALEQCARPLEVR